LFDLAIVGAGPTGLACAIEAAKQQLSCLLIDRGCFLNSIYNFPLNMTFFSTSELLETGKIPFIVKGDKPTRDEALKYYWRVAQYYKINMKLFTGIKHIKKEDDTFLLETGEDPIKARNVIIATGYYDNPDMLNVPGEELPHVSHYYTSPHRHTGQKVIVVGGSNSAAIHALELYRYNIDVSLVHRGKNLRENVKNWVLPDILNRIKEGAIPAFFETTVSKIKEKSIILDKKGKKFELPADYILAMTGYHPDFDFIRKIGIKVDENTSIPDFNEITGETNISGLYIGGSLRAGKDSNKIFIENGHLQVPPMIGDIKKKIN